MTRIKTAAPTLPAVILSTFIAACGGSTHPAGDVVLRWIDDDPQHLTDAASYLDPKLRFELTMKTGENRARWRFHDLEPAGKQGAVLRFDRTGPDPWIATEIDIDAREVSLIEVDLVNVPRVGLQLFWAGPGEQFSTDRMELASLGQRHGVRKTYRFELGKHPAWRDEVDRLRIDVSPEENRRMGIASLRGFGLEVNPTRLTDAVERPWKITLGNDTRNSLPALPGLDHDRRLRVPDDATLVFGYGLQPAVNIPVRFVVQAVIDDGRPTTLFDRTVTAGRSRRGSWHDGQVDLDAYAGREITLRLSTEAVEHFDLTHGVPVWSNPEVVAPVEPDGRPNVLVILLDTLRADHLSSYGYDLPTSPAIDRWGKERATRFSTVVAPAPWTLPSHVSIFTGLDAMRHGFNFWGTAPASLEMIAETLRGEGYSTAAITGGGVMLPQFGYAQGFDSFAHWTQPDSSGEIDWAFGLATEWLESNRDRRFFLFLHTYEIHFPHRRREPYFSEFADRRGSDPPGGEIDLREREWKNLQFPGLYFLIKRPGADTWAEPLTDAEIDLVGLMYDSAIRKADDHVRRLLDRLDALGLTDDTVVILTSDHGEELGDDRGRAGHAYVSEANVLVPLYIARPGGAGAGAVIDRQVRLIDLQPTILDLVGVAPPFATDGRSLVPLLEGRTAEHPTDAWTYAASSNLGLALRRDEDLKYLFPNAAWSELAEREELYDLGADPGEDNNLAGDDDRLPDLRALAGETILEQHRGYRLEIRNGGRRALAGKLTGLWATHDRVKTADHGCRCVSNPKRSPPSFVVPGGRSTVLLFEGLAGSDVGLEGRLLAPDGTESASFDLSFDLNLVSTPAVIVRRGDDWVLVEDHDTGIETGFILTRHGPDDQVSESPDTAADTLEQLRALGYVQ